MRQALQIEPLAVARRAKQHTVSRRNPLLSSFWWVERKISYFVSHRLLPLIPGIDRFYGRHLRRQLRLSTTTVRLKGLDSAWHGARILVVSDFHTGPFLSCHALKRAIEKLCDLEPDLILLAGDIVSNRLDEFDSHRDAFLQLKARNGVVAVLGNHDHYCGEPLQIKSKLGELGIEVLDNRAIQVSRHKDGRTGNLHIAGIDDYGHGAPDLSAALSSAPCDEPLILLSHNPDILFEAAERGVNLVVSGHTHGGQIRLPGLPPLVTMSQHRITSGRFVWQNTDLVVSRGLGVVGLPLRVFCTPDAVLIELEAAS